MKRLMFLISTEGKTTEQVTKQGWEAFQKFQATYKQAQDQLSGKIPTPEVTSVKTEVLTTPNSVNSDNSKTRNKSV